MKRNQRNRIINGVAVVLGTTILGCGVVYLGGKPLYDLLKAEFTQTVVNGKPNTITEAAEVEKTDTEGSEGENDLSAVKYPYGKLICSSIGLDVLLYFGDTEENLLYGAGIYPGGGVPGEEGTTLISAHDSTYFKPLEQISEGDELEVITNHSHYKYKVRQIKVQNAEDGYGLNAEQGALVLYTCYPFGVSATNRKERFFVYCDLIS